MAARKLEVGVLGVAFTLMVLDAGNGSGWAITSTRAVLAARLDRTAAAPLYDVLAGVANLLPFGEPAFRLSLLGALLGACTLAGIVAATRAFVPKSRTAGVIGAVLVFLAPPFRDLLATPQILAACGTVWTLAFLVQHARTPDARTLRSAFAAAALVVGSAPWLGLALVIATATRGKRSTQLFGALAAIGALVILWWFDAIGSIPGFRVELAEAIGTSGRGAGAVVVGAGLLGLGFAAATSLPHVRLLGAIAGLVALHEIVVGSSAVALLAILAVAASIVAAAICKLALDTLTGWQRDLAVLACGAPLLVAAFATGATIASEANPTPRMLVADLVDQLPPGPGTFLSTRSPSWFAIQYERTVAGLRPDLDVVPPLPPQRADVIAADALRAGKIVAADAAAFGRLDVKRASPRDRGFQLLATTPEIATPVDPPAPYTTATGAGESLALAIERARLEAASNRLDAAARAAGLASRFGAADLAVLGATLPSRAHPALFGFLPLGEVPRGPWLADTFGDDLAWVAAIAQPEPPADAPMPRKLHALWRQIFGGTLKPDAPAIAALGPTAVAATAEMMREVGPTR